MVDTFTANSKDAVLFLVSIVFVTQCVYIDSTVFLSGVKEAMFPSHEPTCPHIYTGFL